MSMIGTSKEEGAGEMAGTVIGMWVCPYAYGFVLMHEVGLVRCARWEHEGDDNEEQGEK
jgi:hypothetical protein